MTEAAGAVLRHCFTAMDTHRVETLIEPENAASRALAVKLGFGMDLSPCLAEANGLMRPRHVGNV
jgi:hypothetical protein